MSDDFSQAAGQKPKAAERKRKSEVVTVRLDPKLKYMAELAARRLRRTLSSYIEWVIEDSLSRVHPSYEANQNSGDYHPTFAEKTSALWDVDEPDRFAKLAFSYPELLDHEEQRIWKLICECEALWRHSLNVSRKKVEWEVKQDSLDYELLRKYWQTFRDVANGEKPVSDLPPLF